MNKSDEGFRNRKSKIKKPINSVDRPDSYYDEVDRKAQEKINNDKKSKHSLDNYDGW